MCDIRLVIRTRVLFLFWMVEHDFLIEWKVLKMKEFQRGEGVNNQKKI